MANVICKWCGAKVDPAKKACGRCGRKLSPLSDCGGFYDIVPNAPREDTMAASEETPRFDPIPAPIFKSAGAPGWMKVTLGTLVVAVVALGVLSIGQLGRIRELEDRLAKPVIQPPVVTDPVETEPPTETTPPTEESRPTVEGPISQFMKDRLQGLKEWEFDPTCWLDFGKNEDPEASAREEQETEDLQDAVG